MQIRITDQGKTLTFQDSLKKMITLEVAGGAAFWITDFVIAISPIAVAYKAAFSISSAVVKRERLKRMPVWASSSLMPMATKVGLDSSDSEAQALPGPMYSVFWKSRYPWSRGRLPLFQRAFPLNCLRATRRRYGRAAVLPLRKG